MKILLIEDNLRLAELVKHNLERDNFIVDIANTIADAKAIVSTYKYDLLILDLNLPDGNGEKFLTELRKKKVKIPVIILTANTNFDTKINNLNIGADDFLTKPVKHEELVARIKAILRRPIVMTEKIFKENNLKFNFNTLELIINKKIIKLSKKENQLFEILVKKFNKLVTKDQIENQIYDYDKEISANPIEVTLFRLRKKLEQEKSLLYIKNLKGMGYKLTNEKK